MKIKVKGAVVSVEHANGDAFNFARALRRILKTQNMEEWKKDPQDFQFWVRESVADLVRNIEYVLR